MVHTPPVHTPPVHTTSIHTTNTHHQYTTPVHTRLISSSWYITAEGIIIAVKTAHRCSYVINNYHECQSNSSLENTDVLNHKGLHMPKSFSKHCINFIGTANALVNLLFMVKVAHIWHNMSINSLVSNDLRLFIFYTYTQYNTNDILFVERAKVSNSLISLRD